MRIEMSEPFPIGNGEQFMCLAKLVGRRIPLIPRVTSMPPVALEPTETLVVVSETGRTPEIARAKLKVRLEAAQRELSTSSEHEGADTWFTRMLATLRRPGGGSRSA